MRHQSTNLLICLLHVKSNIYELVYNDYTKTLFYYYYLFKQVWSCDCLTCNIKTSIDDKELRKYIQWGYTNKY